jgi:hypothetical protein
MGKGKGDFASGPAGPFFKAVLTGDSRFATYTYVINNTGFDDKDGDKWSFLFPGSSLNQALDGGINYHAFVEGSSGTFSDSWDPQISLTDTKGPPAPEPTCWVLMLIGLGGIGSALRATRGEASRTISAAPAG